MNKKINLFFYVVNMTMFTIMILLALFQQYVMKEELDTKIVAYAALFHTWSVGSYFRYRGVIKE